MDFNETGTGTSPDQPESIPFSLNFARFQTVEGSIAIIPSVGDPYVVALELQLAGIPIGSAALTEESALDLALRLVGTVMKRRSAPRSPRCYDLLGMAGDSGP